MIEKADLALRKQFFSAASIGFGFVCIGLLLGYPSGAIPSLQSDNSTLPITEEEATWIGSLTPVGSIFGTLAAGPFLWWLGRRNFMLLLFTPLMILGWALIAAAVHVSMILAGRLIGGICLGMAFVAGPLYIVELSDVNHRGIFGAAPMIMCGIGILISYILGALMNWLWMAVASMMFVLPFVLLMWLVVPESPVWLISKGKTEKAYDTLKELRSSLEVAREQMASMSAHSSNGEGSTGFRDMLQIFQQSAVLKAFSVATFLMTVHQFSGVSVVLFYTVTVFDESGSDLDPNIASIIVGAVNLLASILSGALVERLGRRPLLSSSCLFAALGQAGLGTYFYLQAHHQSTGLGWLPLVSVMLFFLAFSLGLGPLGFLVTAEVLPLNARSFLMPVVICINSLACSLTTKTFVDVKNALSLHGTFWMYGGFCLLGAVFTLCFVPETQGKTEDEIQKHFTKRKSTPAV